MKQSLIGLVACAILACAASAQAAVDVTVGEVNTSGDAQTNFSTLAPQNNPATYAGGGITATYVGGPLPYGIVGNLFPLFATWGVISPTDGFTSLGVDGGNGFTRMGIAVAQSLNPSFHISLYYRLVDMTDAVFTGSVDNIGFGQFTNVLFTATDSSVFKRLDIFTNFTDAGPGFGQASVHDLTILRSVSATTVLDTGSLPQGVPEPATWAMMITGFGMAGVALRNNRKRVLAKA